jgi:hypothetical protein
LACSWRLAAADELGELGSLHDTTTRADQPVKCAKVRGHFAGFTDLLTRAAQATLAHILLLKQHLTRINRRRFRQNQ